MAEVTDYNTEIIGRDSAFAKDLGALLDDTQEFAKNGLVTEVHRKVDDGKSVAWGITANTDYDLAIVSMVGEKQSGSIYDRAHAFVTQGVLLADIIASVTGIDMHPVSMSNIVDLGDVKDDDMLRSEIYKGMFDACNTHEIVMVAGESAVLPGRVLTDFNVSGSVTMLAKKGSIKPGVHRIRYKGDEINFVVGSHDGKIIEERCDGNGTKPELNMERIVRPFHCARDTAAMVRDDMGKKLVDIIATVYAVEAGNVSGDIRQAEAFAKTYGIGLQVIEALSADPHVMNWHDASGTIGGYKNRSININATAIGLCTEDAFHNPCEPKEGDTVFFLRSRLAQDVRSNGLSGLRPALVQNFGDDHDYHINSQQGRKLAELTGNGSVIYYEAMQHFYRNGIATRSGHLSGGGAQKKFFGELKEFGLGGEFEVSFDFNEHPAHRIYRKIHNLSARECADKFAYCFTGWTCITPGREDEAIEYLQKASIDAARAGRLEKMDKPEARIMYKAIGQEVTFR